MALNGGRRRRRRGERSNGRNFVWPWKPLCNGRFHPMNGIPRTGFAAERNFLGANSRVWTLLRAEFSFNQTDASISSSSPKAYLYTNPIDESIRLTAAHEHWTNSTCVDKINLNGTGSHRNISRYCLLVCFAKLAHVNNIDVNNLIIGSIANLHPPEYARSRLTYFASKHKKNQQHKWSLQQPEHSTSMKQKKEP